jgi:hypothetical protein
VILSLPRRCGIAAEFNNKMAIENTTIFIQPGEASYVGNILIPIIVAGIVAAVSIYISRYQKKMTSHAAVAEAFRMLNDVKHREARKVLYDIDDKKSPREAPYNIIGINSGEPSNQEALVDICKDIVRNDFNEISTLVYYRLLDGEIFINENFWIILKVWNLAERDIKERRERHSFNYMLRLEELADKACKYADQDVYRKVHTEYCTGPKAPRNFNAKTAAKV